MNGKGRVRVMALEPVDKQGQMPGIFCLQTSGYRFRESTETEELEKPEYEVGVLEYDYVPPT
jgi:hypothetical protein